MTSTAASSISLPADPAHHGSSRAAYDHQHTGAMDLAGRDDAPVAATAGQPREAPTTVTPEANVAAPIATMPAAAASDVPQEVPLVLKFEVPLLFGQKNVPFSAPHHSQDLIGLYGVTPTAAKVARTDPVTGEKINKLRSSYQNHIKAFQIAGRNKPIKHEDTIHGMSLREMAAWPAEEWRNQKVATKEVASGLSDSTLAKIEKAVKMEPGSVPRNDEWENILGHEKSKPGIPGSPAAEGEGKPSSQAVRGGKANGHTNGNAALSGDSEAIRARRTGKRRRYDDESFEGYGEGYMDDERDEADGFSSDGGAKKKKRRKDISSINSPGSLGSYGMSVQQQSIGRGIGAFGGR